MEWYTDLGIVCNMDSTDTDSGCNAVRTKWNEYWICYSEYMVSQYEWCSYVDL